MLSKQVGRSHAPYPGNEQPKKRSKADPLSNVKEAASNIEEFKIKSASAAYMRLLLACASLDECDAALDDEDLETDCNPTINQMTTLCSISELDHSIQELDEVVHCA